MQRLLVVSAIAGVLGVGPSAQEPSAPKPRAVTPADRASHEKMLRALEEIRMKAPDENGYLGDARLRQLLELIASHPDEKPRDKAVEVYDLLGADQLRLGDTDSAVASLEHSVELLEGLPEAERRELAKRVHYDLAVACMRLGENQNCIARHTSNSCIMPIRDDGVHTVQEGSRDAIEHLRVVLELAGPDEPIRLAALWLMNIAYMTVGGYPDEVPEDLRIAPGVFTSPIAIPRFLDVAPALGLNTISMSGGAIAEDFDRDGDLDLMVSAWGTADPLRFFRNDEGAFTDVTSEAGLDGLFGGLNMLQVDYDDDGFVDVFVLRGAWLGETGRHPNSLLRNNGDGTFVDVTFRAGMTVHYPTQTGAWADYDRDGDLDVYVGAETIKVHSSQLYRNQGDGTFVDVAAEAGVENKRYTKAISWGDVDLDGYPEAYVSNLSFPNRLYWNRGDGTFEDVAVERGVTEPIYSFPAWFWDFDNDGALDIFVSSYHKGKFQVAETAASYLGLPHRSSLPHVYKGDGRGGFREVGEELGITLVSYPMGSNFGDLNNDGFPDFYLGTGFPAYDGLMPNLMYLNQGGKHFADVTFAGGFGHLQKGHAVVFADLDNDGDQDVFEEMGGAFPGDAFGNVLFENPGFGNRWVRIELVGVDSPRCAIGARIRMEITEGEEKRSIYRHVNSGGTFGANPLTQHIGVGQAEKIDMLEVLWPTTGKTQVFHDVPVGRHVVVTEGSDQLAFADEHALQLGGE